MELLALKSFVVLAAAGLGALALRRHTAAARHLVWVLGVGAALILPLLSVTLPEWHLVSLPGPGADQPASPGIAPGAALPVSAAPPSAPASQPLPQPVARARPRMAAGPPPASPEVAPPSEPANTPMPWTTLLLVAWVVGAGAAIWRVIRGIRSAGRITASGRPVGDRRAAMAGALAAQCGIVRPIRVLELPGPISPMTWGVFRPVILLPEQSVSWSSHRLKAVLLHELAHVRRLDYATQLAAHVVRALYWFNPLAWVAVWRLREEREIACDDAVLARGPRASDYAAHLLDVARSVRPMRTPAVATVCMARPSRLVGRLEVLLDATRSRSGITPATRAVVLAAGLLVVLPVAAATNADPPDAGDIEDPLEAPGILATLQRAAASLPPSRILPASSDRQAQQACDWNVRQRNMSASHNMNDDKVRIRITYDDCRLEIDMEGEITFTPDERDVASISRGGYFEIETNEDGLRHRLELRPAGDGTLTRRWWVGRDEQPYGAGAAAWLAEMLPVVFRRAGLDAEARAARILATSGTEGLLAEIALIPSDWVAGRYYRALLAQPDLDPETVRTVVRDAGERIDSDFELARLLRTVAENQAMDDAVRVAYVEAAGNLESDFEHRRVLSAILQRENITPELADQMLRSARNIDSDHERAGLLREVLAAHPLDRALTPAFFDAVREIESDFEQRRVLQFALERGAPDREILDRTLAVATALESDHELAGLLVEVAGLYPVGTSIPPTYLDAARSLQSDFERGRVLRTLLARDTVSAEGIAAVLDAAASFTSDHELGQVLTEVIRRGPLGAPARPAFFRALDGLGSDFEHQRILTMVLTDLTLDDDLVGRVLESALQIDSDHSLGQVLLTTVDHHTITDALRPAFMRALDAIDSEYTRNQVLSRLYPRGNPGG